MAGDAYLCGELRQWPSKDQMVSILRAAGLRITVGQHSIRFDDLSHFVFQEYGGDFRKPVIEADAQSADGLRQEAALVSSALTDAELAHRFEIYEDQSEILHYLHHS